MNTLTMSFVEELPNFELKLDFMEENCEIQPSGNTSHEEEEQMQPTTKKARFTALETEDLDEIVNSAQAQRAK